MIAFTNIREQYLYGQCACVGERAVEVLRTDAESGTWMTYATIAGRVVKGRPDDPTTYAACMAWARRFLAAGQENPETWPTAAPP